MAPDGHLDPRPVLNAPARPAPSKVTEEHDLVAAVLRKDRKATAEFVSRYADPVHSYVRQRLAPRTDLVDDLVQEVFLAALQGLSAFAQESSLPAWLLGIARHKVEDYYRARLRSHESLSDLDEESTSIPVTFPRFDELIDHSRLKDKTKRILAELPEPYGLALLWRYWERRSAKEMAAQLERLRQAEVQHLHRTVGLHLHVRGLQVAVDDALFMRRFQAFGDLAGNGERFVERDWTLGDAVLQRRTLDVFEDERRGVTRLF